MSIERLREILLGEDRTRVKRLEAELQKIRTTIEDKEALITSLNPVIADLLERKIIDSGEEMAEIVAPLMGPAIKKQVAESKEEMVEALYPVIGQTVRRAVAEAMRKLVRQINERLDKAFNLQGTWLRLKARLTGMPQPLVVIPQVFPFSVEQLFLIDQRTGLLIAHESGKNSQETNGKPQMISGMLTAIQDFVKDAFGPEAEGDLHEVKYGDKMIFVAASPPAFLAAVTQGTAPLQFPDRLRGLLRRIHNTYHTELREFEGDTTKLEGAHEPLQKFIFSVNEAVTPTLKPSKSTDAGKPISTFGKLALAAAIGFALAVGLWLLLKPSGGAEKEQAPVMGITSGVGQFRLEARTSGKVWMRVISDEQDSTDFIFQTDEVYVWHASQSFRMRVGNAGQTELFLNGKNLGRLGEVDQAVSLFINDTGIVEKRYTKGLWSDEY